MTERTLLMVNARLTERQFTAMLEDRSHRVAFGRAEVGMDRSGERFELTGASGRHSLLIAATDLDRLNAHWTLFATDPRNVDGIA